MAKRESLTYRILREHLVSGELEPGRKIAIRIDQTLTQDATGTMAYLQFEAMGVPRVRTELSVSYVDHNTLQTDFENADDHRYLQSVAAKYGVLFSRPGNGICHQVHLERFGVPGKTLLGSDSHTPTGGGLGMLAIGAGGLDVALAMAGEPFYADRAPRSIGVRLAGELPAWVSAKDVILELLRRLTVKGGVGKVFEYFGARRPDPLGPRARHHHEHGRGARRHHLDLPERRGDRRRSSRPRGAAPPGASWSRGPDARASTSVDGDRPGDARAAGRRAAQPGRRCRPSRRSAGTAVEQVCIGSLHELLVPRPDDRRRRSCAGTTRPPGASA